jgi:hypothetical protein
VASGAGDVAQVRGGAYFRRAGGAGDACQDGVRGEGIAVGPLGGLETKNATLGRITSYADVAVFSMLGVARVKRILP